MNSGNDSKYPELHLDFRQVILQFCYQERINNVISNSITVHKLRLDAIDSETAERITRNDSDEIGALKRLFMLLFLLHLFYSVFSIYFVTRRPFWISNVAYKFLLPLEDRRLQWRSVKRCYELILPDIKDVGDGIR